MFKRFKLPALVLGTALALLSPSMALARDYEREHHRHRFSIYFGYGPRHYAYGYYDRWGFPDSERRRSTLKSARFIHHIYNLQTLVSPPGTRVAVIVLVGLGILSGVAATRHRDPSS
jgi:hypothetical protein